MECVTLSEYKMQALATPTALRLSELTQQIQQAIEGPLGNRNFWVIADVTNHTFKKETGYHYFELVEKDGNTSRMLARINARAWGSAAVHLSNFEEATGQKFKNDIRVLVSVSVQYHPTFGLQLKLLDIDTSFTLGQFEQQRKATLAKLLRENTEFIRKEGDLYITRNNRLSLSKVIQRIAVVSSDTSAGYQDFKHTLDHNGFNYGFEIDNYFTKVQGEANAKPFLARMIEIFNSGKDYDAVVIIRGGGSQTDFLIFDNYELSRAIAKFPIPVITGIGHQKNETIVDLMAHTSTKTPTKVAELIIAHNRKFEESILHLQKLILIKTQQLFLVHSKALNDLKSSLTRDVLNLINSRHRTMLSLSGMFTGRPKTVLSNKRKDLDHLVGDLKVYQRIYFANKRGYLAHYQSVVNLMSPQNILNKGFAILKVNGQIINTAKNLNPGDELDIHLAASEIKTIVRSKEQKNGDQSYL